MFLNFFCFLFYFLISNINRLVAFVVQRMEELNIRAVLPKIKANKKLIKWKEKRARKYSEEEEKEFSRIHGRNILKDAKKDSKKTQAKAEKKKERRPKTIIANSATGKETLSKHKARELVKEKRAKERKLKKQQRRSASKVSRRVKQEEPTKDLSFSAPEKDALEDDKDLLLKTIRGDSSEEKDLFLSESIYPDFDVEHAKPSNFVSEEEVLEKANQYFASLRKKEREINRAAAIHLKKMKEVNRQGGDKDGFRYVLPKNTKVLVRQMMEREGMGTVSLTPSASPSLFNSLNNADDVNDKPQRRTKKRGGTYSDFYQFQVSKRWTRNAERFLFRDRVDKSLFESKKRQRSIKNL